LGAEKEDEEAGKGTKQGEINEQLFALSAV
jgi:hypothetical protein